MKEIKLEEQKKLELDILRYVKKICEENNIKFGMAGGTAIGAVRHKGFIPWDDDIDVFMRYDDYIKFIEIVKKDNNDTYKILTPYDNEDYYYLFSKIVNSKTTMIEKGNNTIKNMGVYIDIFPIHKLPNDYEEAKKYCKYINRLNGMYVRHTMLQHYYKSSNKRKEILKAITLFPEHIYYLLFFRNKNMKEYVLSELEKYNKNEKSDYEGYVISIYKERDIMRKEIYSDTIDMEFENEMFPMSALYDEYLTRLYGNYMELPPIEKRVSHHNYEVYWK